MIIDMKNVKDKKDDEEKQKLSREEEILKTVQANGYIEIKQYEKLAHDFIKNIEGLAIFKKLFSDSLSEQIRFMLLDEILGALVKPIFEGNMPALMNPEGFNAMRRDMYAELISKYIDNTNDEEPF